ncbi:thioredoxin domain-containing protein, partial [Myxococcota bacterium]|nr:thioredoxin domain-containing protein [Myxococcota bacterium]
IGAAMARENRLARETSPYLQQHSNNPVDWYPWGPEALNRAKELNRPIFLSIGYSSCHWCHVMAHESFEDEGVAAFLSEHFVSIKVDREERPDIDSLYMDAVIQMTGSGGWPLNCFLTPDKIPFYGGTYFPPEGRYGRMGFMELLRQLADFWRDAPDTVRESASHTFARVTHRGGQGEFGEPHAFISRAEVELMHLYDRVNGGFGTSPKFPRPLALAFLLERGTPMKEASAFSLGRMARGGIHDHIGGGFHRYSTDEAWRTPHFEKMLYDNALLAGVYTRAFAKTKDREFGAVARRTLDFMMECMMVRPSATGEMTGGFFSSFDADSRGANGEVSEGAYYVWTKEEILTVLGPDTGNTFCEYYGITDKGSFAGDPSLQGMNTLAIGAEALAPMDEALAVLGRHRQRRSLPGCDTKIITAWNGLAVSALAYAGQILHEPRYLAAALQSAGFIMGTLWHNSILHRSYCQGFMGSQGVLEDYIFMAAACFDCFNATGEPRWLSHSRELMDRALELFADPRGSGLVFSVATDLPAAVRRMEEGVVPSADGVAAVLLGKLEAIFGAGYAAKGVTILSTALKNCTAPPSASPGLALAALAYRHDLFRSIVISGKLDDPLTRALYASAREHQGPFDAIVLTDRWESVLPEQLQKGEAPAAHLCQDHSCLLPITDPDLLAKILDAPQK